jgi:tRNA-specific 2-thiouridylase
MSSKGRVLVAMSGGIDSSLAAVLLHEEGYEVVGMTMKTWDYASSGSSKKETGCCSLDSINDARNIAVDLGFPHYILDIREEFGDSVIDHFTSEYIAGRTPNPCVMCNTHIKWDALLRRADKLECQFIATGHYARITEKEGRFIIQRGIDDHKDQSYALWGVSQESLSRTILPLGNLLKSEIYEMATQKGFYDLVNKSESYEICFIPDNDYRGFLKRRVPTLEAEVAGGNFVTADGTVLGTHEGYPFYTIGQRKGLGITLGFPAFVTEIRKETNEVVLGDVLKLLKNGMSVSRLNLMKHPEITDLVGKEVVAKIRYNDKGSLATIVSATDKSIEVHFHEPVNAIAPGQAAVFYDSDDVVAGGWIMKSYNTTS